MTKTYSLKKNEEFREVYRLGKSYANKYLIMYVLGNNKSVNHLGISISKKVGNSVVRHRLKRLLKESYRLHEEMFSSGLNIVILVRVGAKNLNYEKIESALLHLGRLHNIILE